MVSINNLTNEDEVGDLRQRLDKQMFPWVVAGENIAYGFEEKGETGVTKA
jgi:uncharacterized protein YkwD